MPTAPTVTGHCGRTSTTGGIVQELVRARKQADALREQNADLRRANTQLRRQLAAAKTQAARFAKLAEAAR